MEWKRRNQSSLLLWATVAALLSQNLVVPLISAAASVEDQKNYYPSPDPGSGTPSTPSGSTGHSSPPRSPSGGHGSHGSTPPANCGNPPSGHTPTPSTPSGGGGYHYSPPSTTPTTPTPTPTTPTAPTTPTTPFVPSPFFTPPTPTTPIDPGTPTTPTTPFVPSPFFTPPTPTTPFVPSPFFTPPTPTTPIDPGTPSTPGITIPSPPFDPNSPPFTCVYWRNHSTLIWRVLGLFGTVGGTFGATSVPGFGSNMSLMEALANSRTDGYGALYREGTASFLNSMVSRGRFPYTTKQVRDRFVSSLTSNKIATNQARLFKLANEGRVKL